MLTRDQQIAKAKAAKAAHLAEEEKKMDESNKTYDALMAAKLPKGWEPHVPCEAEVSEKKMLAEMDDRRWANRMAGKTNHFSENNYDYETDETESYDCTGRSL